MTNLRPPPSWRRTAPPSGFVYAEFKTRTGRLAEARLLLDELTADTPDFLPAWRLLAQVALAEKKFDEAFTLADNVILRDPVNIEARLIQIQVLLAKGDVAKAIENLEALDTSFPKSSSDKASTGARLFAGRKICLKPLEH